MAALDGALALEEVDDVPVLVAEDLHLDVAGLLEVLLHVEVAVAEGRVGLRAGHLEGRLQFLLAPHDPHALAAAPGAGLEDDGVADLLGQFLGFVRGGHRAVGPGQDGDARRLHGPLGLGLVPHEGDGLGARADEGDVARLADLGELRRLGEEAVAGVDGVGVADLRRGDEVGDLQVGVAAGGGPDADVLVGEAHVEGIDVHVRVDGHRLDAQLLAGPDDPEGDLASVGDEDFSEHGALSRWDRCA